MMQEWIVALIVVCATAFVVRRYASRNMRDAARATIARAARKLGWMRFATRFENVPQPSAGCGSGCGTCGGCAAPAGETKSIVRISRLAP